MRPPAGEILQNEYRLKINQVMNYIRQHYREDLDLDKLARMAGMSKYHFHRIFKSVAGQTTANYIRHLRHEEANIKLICYPHKSITEIALECGFSSSQNFAKMFKAFHGGTPSRLRKDLHWQNFCKTLLGLKERNKDDLSPQESLLYDEFCVRRQLPLDQMLHQPVIQDIQVRQMPDLPVAYIRCIGPTGEEIPESFKRLFQWAIPSGNVQEGMMVVVVMWSNASLTPEDKRIFDVCITLSESVKNYNGISTQTIPGGLYAVRHCEVESEKFYDEMWMSFIFNWAMRSNYQLDVRPTRPLYLRYCQPVETHPLKHHVLDLYLPIKPLHE